MANVSLYLISTAVLFLMGSLVKAINSNVFDSSVGEMISCGVADPTEADRIARDSAFSFQKFQSRHRRQSDEGKLLFGSSPEDVRTVIPVCFHAPSNIFNRILRRQHATDREIQQQLDHLNEAFSAKSCCDSKLFWCTDGECSVDTNIRFALAVTDRFGRLVAGETTENTRDPRACITRKIRLRTRVIQGSRRERRIYSRLRKGDSSVLNIYLLKVQRSAVLPIIDGGYLLGSATFPWDYIHDPLMDGVVVRPNTLTGGSFPTKTEGDTLVHEIG